MSIKIAVLAPSKLPIPSVKGGAIETLFTHLLDENEKHNLFQFDVFCYGDEVCNKLASKYKNSKFFIFDYSWKDLLYNKFWAAIYRLTRKKVLARSALAKKTKDVITHNVYDYILIEGNFFQINQLFDLKVPILYHLHTDILNDKEPCCALIVSKCYKILVISDFLKRQISKVVGSSENIILYKNAIDVNCFKDIAGNGDILRRQLGIPNNDKIAIYCGRIVPIKGVFEMVKAFAEANIFDLSLIIVGGSNFADSYLSEYEKKIKEYIYENRLKVFFTGYIPQNLLPKYYALADFSICPSICNEAAGLVIIEAHSCTLPVIASRKGGIPEYVCVDGSILVDCNENFIQNLSRAIKQMYIEFENKRELLINSNYRDEYSLVNYYRNFQNIVQNI